jgi:hypothetical protein
MRQNKEEAKPDARPDQRRGNAKPKDKVAKAAQDRLAEQVTEETELPQKGAP